MKSRAAPQPRDAFAQFAQTAPNGVRECHNTSVIWLGEKRGDLSDWTTQQWIRATGRYISLSDHAWLDGPAGGTRQIGKRFFEKYADDKGLKTVRSGVRGLIPDFSCLEEGNNDLAAVSPAVKDFYEQTSEFELDAWSEWNGFSRLSAGR
jgi:hypothetical protein